MMMGEVVNVDKDVMIGPEWPCIFERFEPLLWLDCKLVLFHGFEGISFAFPNSAVAVVKDVEMFFVGKFWSSLDGSHWEENS